ncbi:MAG: NAD(P)/FAD-dependent oxidoreductase [Clostridiaceae bacterium]|jgi:predicted Rossmann fold flavoprotein|nr:NAD(P)/FAD-dependent oxidoreductase [Clostridiaceae bacterium]
MKKVGVIGAGAAGLMAAGRAAERGHRVLVFEKNDIAGKKVRITGKGRCNITNTCDIDTFISNVPGNGRFLYSSLYTFSNAQTMDFFEGRGVPIKIERGGRVFPASDKAKDAADALRDYVIQNKGKILYHSLVKEILIKDDSVTGVKLKDGTVESLDAVIVATGGVSYSGTGSTGEGHEMARKLGHTVTDLKPSLVPLNTKEEWVRELQGLSLKNVAIYLSDKRGKRIYDDFGEMMFTHFGVTGPVILSASRHIMKYDYKNVYLSIDLKPALDENKLDSRLQRDFVKYSRKQFKNSLNELFPNLLIPVMVKLSRIPPDKPVHQISREERLAFVKLMKNLTCEISGSRPIDEAIVTAGGVSVKEIEPSTMESRIIKGLYFAGEVLDVDAYTGGFNLTVAFSTGYTAGNSV